MTTKNINDKLQGAATLWQLIFSVVSVIVVVLAFAFSLRADVNSSLRETTRNAADIIEVKDELHKHEEKVDVIQRQILDAINDLKLFLLVCCVSFTVIFGVYVPWLLYVCVVVICVFGVCGVIVFVPSS